MIQRHNGDIIIVGEPPPQYRLISKIPGPARLRKYLFFASILLCLLFIIIGAIFATKSTKVTSEKIQIKEYIVIYENASNLTGEPANPKALSTTKSYTINRTMMKYPIFRQIIFKIIRKQLVCIDGTKLGFCSMQKPLFCDLDGLTEKPTECGCPIGERPYDNQCIEELPCSDGSFEPDCSDNKPKQCIDGILVDNVKLCGCPNNYIIRESRCIMTCSDGTAYNECSKIQPLYCDNGTLRKKASTCGCSSELAAKDEDCVQKYLVTAKKELRLPYVIGGSSGFVKFTVYEGLLHIPEKQYDALDILIEAIKNLTTREDDQLRIAVSVVQKIPYDNVGANKEHYSRRTPYEVIYDNKGICSDKSVLLAVLLTKLGYGTVLFDFDTDLHKAVGVLCPHEFGYASTNYCFIESTEPSIITYSHGVYWGAGKLNHYTGMFNFSSGKSFKSAAEEYNDAWDYHRLVNAGLFLEEEDYNKWQQLVKKYGLEANS